MVADHREPRGRFRNLADRPVTIRIMGKLKAQEGFVGQKRVHKPGEAGQSIRAGPGALSGL